MQYQTGRLSCPPCPSLYNLTKSNSSSTRVRHIRKTQRQRKLFATKSHSREASRLITLIGMLTKWKEHSLPRKMKHVKNLQAVIL